MRNRILALTGWLLLGSSLEARETWHEVSSPSFLLVTNASDGAAESLLETAERFRTALGLVLPQIHFVTRHRARLYGFRDADSLEPFLPRPDEEPAYVAGYFQGLGGSNVIVLDLSLRKSSYESVLFHEYLHLVLRLEGHDLPLWFEEGLSEFYAATKLGRTHAELGAKVSRHLFVLSRGELVPLEELLLVDEGSPRYTDAAASSLFYAQSWSLVHYLLARAPSGQEQLARFLARSRDGADSIAAFRESFQRDPSVVEEELRQYVKAAVYPTFRIAIPRVESKEARSKRLSRADVHHRWGELFLSNGRALEARVSLEEACRLDPALAGPREALGLLDLAEGNAEAARERFEQAIALEDASAEALYQYGKLVLGDYSGSWVGEIPEDVAARATSALRRSLALEPGAKGPSELLAFVYLVRGERIEEAGSLVEAALAGAPGEGSLLFLHGQILAKRGQYQRARDVLQPLLDETRDGTLRDAVFRFLSRMDELERAPIR